MKQLLKALAILLLLAVPAQGALTDNLVSFWELEEASGTRDDAHGANDLTDNATVTQAAGKVGNAGQFTSANSEYLSRADNADLSTGDIDWTITAWIYADTLVNFGGIVHKGWSSSADTNREYVLYVDGGTLRFLVGTNGGSQVVQATNFGALSTATWYFVTLQHDSVGNTIGISVNDGTFNTTSHSLGTQDGTSAFQIGGVSAQSLYWNGRIDQVGFWKRKITSGEITQLYNAGSGISYATLSGGGSPTRRPVSPVIFP
jgi:hypothetical protein